MPESAATPTRCFKCDGKGRYRAKADLFMGVFTLGISALVDKSKWIRCSACNGRGYVR